jgi:membrane associated rhomboid family serine protease
LPGNFAQPAVVFRSARSRACEERAFVLQAVGINSEVEFVGGEIGYEVLVEAVVREQALQQLWMYEQERATRPPPPVEASPPLSGGWRGAVGYVVVLLLVPFLLAQSWFPLNTWDAGTMDPRQIRAGEWWRALTALTLHWDATHLLGNLCSGVLLGISAAQVWGSARAWLLIAVAAAAANLVEGLLDLGQYVSAGASTAVFAALGLVAAHAWHSRNQRTRTLRDWVPLIAGVALLGMFGAGAQDPQGAVNVTDSTNVLSHALGFAMGALLGLAVATTRGARWLAAIPAWLAAAMTPAAVAGAWLLALRSVLIHLDT